MEKEIKTEIVINTTPEKIWAILTHFTEYPNWNPFIISIKGEVQVGNIITARLKPPKSKGMTFKPTILAFKENRELRWLGHLWFTGLFDGEHKFELIDNGNNTTTFRQSEKLNGVLVRFFKKGLEDTTRGFEAMNHKLKEMAEAR